MKILTILLLTTTYLTYGQGGQMECINLETKFQLFAPQIRKGSQIKTITDIKNYPPDSVFIKVNLARIVRYDNDIKGVAVELINTTGKEFRFHNGAFQDFFCQIKANGNWLTIEKNIQAWDDVFVELVVPSNCYVTAILPCYRGTEPVTMRYRFAVNGKVFYSQEFEGTINPGILK